MSVCRDITSRVHDNRARGPFLERPCNFTDPESDFDIKVSRKVGRVLTSDEVHVVSLADNFTVQFWNLLKLSLECKTKQLNGPGNYRELRETGSSPVNRDPVIAVLGSRLTGLRFFHVIAFAGPARLIKPMRVQNQARPVSRGSSHQPSAINRAHSPHVTPGWK